MRYIVYIIRATIHWQKNMPLIQLSWLGRFVFVQTPWYLDSSKETHTEQENDSCRDVEVVDRTPRPRITNPSLLLYGFVELYTYSILLHSSNEGEDNVFFVLRFKNLIFVQCFAVAVCLFGRVINSSYIFLFKVCFFFS